MKKNDSHIYVATTHFYDHAGVGGIRSKQGRLTIRALNCAERKRLWSILPISRFKWWIPSFPDLKVNVVDSFLFVIGEWKFVKSGEDFAMQLVDSFPDIKIK